MSENTLLVSVVIPCYNHAQFVQETIQSVIDQDYENIELIIIDDGSKDNSVEVIQEMIPACEQRFVRFEFRHRPNVGLSSTLNEALDWCKGKYFSPVASDDILLPSKISFLLEKIIKERVPAVFGSVERIGNLSGDSGVSKRTELTFRDLMLHKIIPPAPGSLINMAKVKEIGYDPLVTIEDWYMWLKLTEKDERLIAYSEIVAKYRIHGANTISNTSKMNNGRRQVLSHFKDSEHYNNAIKNIYLMYAIDLIPKSRARALLPFLKGFGVNLITFKVFLRIFLPKEIINLLQKIKFK